MFHFSNIVRSKGDPKIVEGGPSLKQPPDQLARALGWLGIGLGITEFLAPRRVTEALGMEGRETLVRAFGLREILAGVMSLSVDRNAGLWARVGGDGLDAAALLSGLTSDNPKKGNIALALLMVGGIAMLDYRAAQDTKPRRPPPNARRKLYPNRSGFPKGVQAAKGRAKEMIQHKTAGVTS
ncbi:hypothetical protein A5906_30030 [Bradyrhizobium sacchari]|uniref:Cyclase dehydrase n=1 Tax=Bradyrhizobium sacchari TaxID=1399419 RepID=A0A560K028_9BRAD|nr:hypothetical protein [Bradyrhizobium sacchari]OPY98815.1 hypothetical protein A5906_30030 [Bradyrhizobium sacchari]TWB60280.1 hypothetical protein FBZ94_104504 [Bradyrhizobium sacchari]TWB73910.1 hypothetical protein FBZ95_105161 [Bradyrhizobium sacchari]